MNKEKKIILPLLLIILLSAAVIIGTNFSISPLYDISFGDYYNNLTNGALVIGKGWSQGLLPYKDLFGLEGPLFYLIQRIGWTIGQTNGILLLEILNLSLVEFLIYDIVSQYCSTKKSLIYTLLSLFAYMAFASGGDNAMEFALLPIVGCIDLVVIHDSMNDTIKGFLIGILCGCALFNWIYAGIIGIGIILGYMLKKHKISVLFPILIGSLIIAGIVCCYFMMQGALKDLIQGFMIVPMHGLFTSDSIIKTCAKGCFALVMAICVWLGKDHKNSLFLTLVGITTFICVIIGEGEWHYFMITIFALPVAMSYLDTRISWGSLIVIVVMCGICIVPLKNSASYVLNFDTETQNEFTENIVENVQNNDFDSVYIMNYPTYLYLELDLVPANKYFYHQREIFGYDEEIYNEVIDFLTDDYENGLVMYSSNGGISWNIGNYYYVTGYAVNHYYIGIYAYEYESTDID